MGMGAILSKAQPAKAAAGQRQNSQASGAGLPLAQFSPHKAENYFFNITAPPAVGGNQVLVQGPNFRIAPGSSISIRSTSVATATVGQGDVYVSSSPEDLNGNLGAVAMHILAGSSSLLPIAVDNLNQLWFTAGDVATGGSVGITVTVPQVG